MTHFSDVSFDEHLGWFGFFAIVYRIESISTHGDVSIPVVGCCFGGMLGSGTARSYVSSSLSLLRINHTGFHSGYTRNTPTNSE